MKTLVFHMIEFCELALVNMNRFTERARHNLRYQWLLFAMTKSLTGTNATLSLHTMPLRRHSFPTWCRRQAFLTVASLETWDSHASYAQPPRRDNTCHGSHALRQQHQAPWEHTHYSDCGFTLVTNSTVFTVHGQATATTTRRTTWHCQQATLQR